MPFIIRCSLFHGFKTVHDWRYTWKKLANVRGLIENFNALKKV